MSIPKPTVHPFFQMRASDKALKYQKEQDSFNNLLKANQEGRQEMWMGKDGITTKQAKAMNPLLLANQALTNRGQHLQNELKSNEGQKLINESMQLANQLTRATNPAQANIIFNQSDISDEQKAIAQHATPYVQKSRELQTQMDGLQVFGKALANDRFQRATPEVIKELKNRNLITDDQIRLLDQTFGARKGLIDESYNQALLKTAMDNHAEKATDLNFKYHYGDEEAGWPGLLAYQKEYVMRDYRDDEEIREHEADWRDLNVKRMERYLQQPLVNIDKFLSEAGS